MRCVGGFLSHSAEEMMSLSIPGSANLCCALIAESGKEPVGHDLVLTKRGESFNFTYPGK